MACIQTYQSFGWNPLGDEEDLLMLQNFTKPQFNTKFDRNKAKSILGKVYREQMWSLTSPSKAHIL